MIAAQLGKPLAPHSIAPATCQGREAAKKTAVDYQGAKKTEEDRARACCFRSRRGEEKERTAREGDGEGSSPASAPQHSQGERGGVRD